MRATAERGAGARGSWSGRSRANIVAVPPTNVPAISPQEAAVRQTFAQARAAVAAAAGLQAVPSNLDPPLAKAPADKAAVFVNGCVRSWRDVGKTSARRATPPRRRPWP